MRERSSSGVARSSPLRARLWRLPLGPPDDTKSALAYLACMPPTSPYRSLPSERRVALIAHALQASRETHSLYIQRLVARGGGFRAVTLGTWPVDRLARQIVRMNTETAQDELDLLQLLYVELEPSIQITFLDEAGVRHERGVIAEGLEVPYADAPSVRRAALTVQDRHGAEGMHYLRTLVRYSLDAWPDLDVMVRELAERGDVER